MLEARKHALEITRVFLINNMKLLRNSANRFSCIRYLSILSRVCSNKQMDRNMPGRFSLLWGNFWIVVSICLLSWKKWKDGNLIFIVAWITQCPKVIRNWCASGLELSILWLVHAVFATANMNVWKLFLRAQKDFPQ